MKREYRDGKALYVANMIDTDNDILDADYSAYAIGLGSHEMVEDRTDDRIVRYTHKGGLEDRIWCKGSDRDWVFKAYRLIPVNEDYGAPLESGDYVVVTGKELKFDSGKEVTEVFSDRMAVVLEYDSSDNTVRLKSLQWDEGSEWFTHGYWVHRSQVLKLEPDELNEDVLKLKASDDDADDSPWLYIDDGFGFNYLKPISGAELYEAQACSTELEKFIEQFGFIKTIKECDFGEFIQYAKRENGWIPFLEDKEFIEVGRVEPERLTFAMIKEDTPDFDENGGTIKVTVHGSDGEQYFGGDGKVGFIVGYRELEHDARPLVLNPENGDKWFVEVRNLKKAA